MKSSTLLSSVTCKNLESRSVKSLGGEEMAWLNQPCSLHTGSTSMQCSTICNGSSATILQTGHRLSSTTCRLMRVSIVGKALLKALHANTFTLFGTCNFQSPLQNCFWGVGLELLALLDKAEFANILYALRVVKTPVGVWDHMRRSGGSLALKGMLRISFASNGMNSC